MQRRNKTGRRSSCPLTGDMEVKGEPIIMATCNIGSPGSQRYTKAIKIRVERMKELRDRQGKLEERLRRKIAELKELCLQEAKLTGRLPIDYPLQPGEMPPAVDRRVRTSRKLSNHSMTPGEDVGLWDLEHRFELQGRIANASPTLAVRTALAGEQRVRRKHNHQQRKLPDDKPTEIQRISHFPQAHPDETTLTAALRAEGRASPRVDPWGDEQTVGRNHGWTLLPTDIYCQARGHRNSYASPVRMLQRSQSGAGRRSVPSSPVIYRDRSGHYRYLSPAHGDCQHLMDSTDAKAEVSSDTGACQAPGRTRHSSSSETLSNSAALNRHSRRSVGEGRASFSTRTGRSGPQSSLGYHSQCHPVPVSTAQHRVMGGQVDRDIHRALALEGLRSWYMRTAVYGYQQEHSTLGWDRRLHPTGAVRVNYSPMIPRVNWEAGQRPTRTSHQVVVTPRGHRCDSPCGLNGWS
ncbi:coiled-coil domain-containing protein 120-like isoform X2 [Scyliorhinus torazame]|uniref:coiled-coil domain-containing protein 120-like isoform X2 n=1 Tax=Scyliorhinus torazame TaxID=75743 RepID=UPI003B592EAA